MKVIATLVLVLEKALKQGRAIQVSQSKAALEALEKYEKEQENDNTV